MGIETVEPDDDEPQLVAELRNGTGLKLPGCYVISLALQLSILLLTFDQRLARTA